MRSIDIGGDAEACNCLGLIYESGFGLEIEQNELNVKNIAPNTGGRSLNRDRNSSREKLAHLSKRSGGNVDVRESTESVMSQGALHPWEDESNPDRALFKALRMYE